MAETPNPFSRTKITTKLMCPPDNGDQFLSSPKFPFKDPGQQKDKD